MQWGLTYGNLGVMSGVNVFVPMDLLATMRGLGLSPEELMATGIRQAVNARERVTALQAFVRQAGAEGLSPDSDELEWADDVLVPHRRRIQADEQRATHRRPALPRGIMLDASALAALGNGSTRMLALLTVLRSEWPPMVLSAELVTVLDATTRRPPFPSTKAALRGITIITEVHLALARAAAELRARAGLGSEVQALTAAYAKGRTLITASEDVAVLGGLVPDVVVIYTG